MTRPTRQSEIKKNWHLLDAQDQILGRFSSRIIPLLIGKNKPYFVRNLDCGDHVVVINAKEIAVTGKKETQKNYYSYSGYPGGLKITSFRQMKEKFPERIIINAVSKMLPNNKLRPLWLKHLHVFAGSEHGYQDKFVALRSKTQNTSRYAAKLKTKESK